MTITLFKAWAYGQKDYIARLVELSTAVETYLNQIFAQLTGQSGSLAVPYGLQEIFDRQGIIGSRSYDFEEGTLTSPDYHFTVQPGAYWNAGTFYQKASTSTISMAGKASDTYYLNLDSAGNPVVADAPDGTTTRSFSWNGSAISAKALYAETHILIDGDDYDDCLDSVARSKTFTRVADRLEEIEAMVAEMGSFYALDHLDGLDVYYKAGICRDADSQPHITVEGHVTCTNNSTNYIEVDPATGTVSVNQTGFTSGFIPLFQAVAAAGVITLTDKRTWACVGGGGGGGGHAQNTDTGTTAPTFTVDTGASGSPPGRAGFAVENGDDPNAAIKFNRDTGRWQYSTDGEVSWKNLGELDIDLGAQELSKHVALENPPLVLEDLARGSSVDYEDLDLSSHITAPLGVQVAVLRVYFWDSAPGSSINVLFRKKGSSAAPALAFAVWSGSTDPATILVPLDNNLVCQFFVNASGADTANLRVLLLGYAEKVSGVGTLDKTVVHTGLNVAGGATQDFNLSGFLNRGLAHYLKVEETGGNVVDGYDVHLYARDTFTAAELLYKAEGIDPASAFEDWLPFWVQDKDGTSELHLRIVNHDADQAGVFSLTLACEQFA